MSPLPIPRVAFSLRYELRYCEFMLFDRAVIARQMTRSLPPKSPDGKSPADDSCGNHCLAPVLVFGEGIRVVKVQ